MPEFLTTSAVAYQIDRLLIEAKREVVLISPYLKMSRILVERLQDCERRGVALRLVYGKSDLRHDQREILDSLGGLERYFLENLHAKCYYNEQVLVISSMNMYEFSEKTNREMGVLLTEADDAETFAAAKQEAESIIQAAKVERQATAKPSWIQRVLGRAQGPEEGRCIRCGSPREIDPDKPLCQDCYDIWAQYGDPHYEEAYCHMCGKKADTSVAKPLCVSCFRQVGYW